MRIFFTTLYRRRAGRTIPLVLAVLCVLFGVGALGYSFGQKSVRSEKNGVVGLINKTSNTTETVDFEAFWKTRNKGVQGVPIGNLFDFVFTTDFRNIVHQYNFHICLR